MARIAVVFCLLLVVVAAAPKKKKSSAIAGRIIGGKFTEINTVPYQVSLHYFYRFKCGGSIIGPRHVLTAAHCVNSDTPSHYIIRAGSKFNGNGEVREVKKIIRHPDYLSYTVENDIAILELEKPLKFNQNIQSIKLTEKEPKAGEKILVSGWGALIEGGTTTWSLSSVNITVVNRDHCKNIYKYFRTVTDSMFCAGETEGGKDACDGDSGGPAVLDGRLAGIVSWAEGCARKNTPGVYTNVFKYRNWIKTEIHSCYGQSR